MKLVEARQQFIQTWGALATQWGINRTMAQIHALLITAPDALSAEEVMEQLNISRGNANMNLRELIDWQLVERVIINGERKEFFTAEKDIWKVATQVAKERKRRELDPVIKVLDQVSVIEDDKKDKETKAFLDTIKNIRKFARQTDKTLETIIKAEENWFYSSLLKIIK